MSSAIPAWSVGRFHPLRDNILVRRRLPDATTGAGVLIPDAVRKPLDIGRVMAVGPGRRAPDGSFTPRRSCAGAESWHGGHPGWRAASRGE